MTDSTIKEAMNKVDPETQVVVRAILDQRGLQDVKTVRELISRINPGSISSDEFAAITSLRFSHKAKFAAKLTHEQRCEVLALHHMGIGREILSRIYGVDRRTITHIHNENSPHYRDVKDERIGLGSEQFRKKYVTEEVHRNVLVYLQNEKDLDGGNKMANRKQGLHIVRGPMCTYDHRVMIKWLDVGDVEVAGWYYQDMDGDLPTKWFIAGGPETLRNSQACFNAMINDIADKIT